MFILAFCYDCHMKYRKLIIGAIAVFLLSLFVFFLWRGQAQRHNAAEWSLQDREATYVIHGAADFDTGPGYYLYKTKGDTTLVARIDAKASVSLVHFTDRPVLLSGAVTVSPNGQAVATIRWIRERE